MRFELSNLDPTFPKLAIMIVRLNPPSDARGQTTVSFVPLAKQE
jgi:hypothetical protein